MIRDAKINKVDVWLKFIISRERERERGMKDEWIVEGRMD